MPDNAYKTEPSTIKWGLNPGQIITIIVLVVGMAASWGSLSQQIATHTEMLGRMSVDQATMGRDLLGLREEQARVRGKLEEHDREDSAWRAAHRQYR